MTRYQGKSLGPTFRVDPDALRRSEESGTRRGLPAVTRRMFQYVAMDAITIRRATTDQVNGILECLRSAFARYQSAYTAGAYEDTVLNEESLLRRLEEMTVLVALDGSGYVLGTLAHKVVTGSEAHLRGMAVRPGYQGMGIADQLLERAEEELSKQNCSHISLDTTQPLERAMAFYERHGYRRSGKQQDFFGMPLIEYVKVLPVEK